MLKTRKYIMAKITIASLTETVATKTLENLELKNRLELAEQELKEKTEFYYAASQDLILAADLIQPGFKGNIHTLIHDETMKAHSGPDVGQPADQVKKVLDQEAIDSSMSRMKWAETTGKPQWSMDPAKNAEMQRIIALKQQGIEVVTKWEKVLEQMKFATQKVQFEKHIGRKPSERFLSSFEVHIKRTEDKFMFIPVTENEATLEFARDFVKAAKMMRLEVEVEGKKMVLKLDAGRKEGGGAWFRYTYK